MKRHSTLAATAIAAAFAIAMPASAGPLGGITGGAGAGVLGTLGGTVASPISTLGAGAGAGAMGMVGGTLAAPTSTLGGSTTGALGAGGQAGVEVVRPGVTIERLPLRRATQTLDAVGDRAKSTAGNVIERVDSTQLPSLPSSAGGNVAAQGGVTAGPASANGEAAAGARIQVSH